MRFPALLLKKTIRRGKKLFYILTLANICPTPITGAEVHIVGIRRIFKPDQTEGNAAGIRQIGSFGDITENSVIDLILPIDTTGPSFGFP